MKLTHLIISNIGPFRGRHIIDLQTDNLATGYAFFAENGRGKTSIYNAMRWCLFGRVKDRAKTVAGKTIQGPIRPIVGDGEILMNDEAYQNDDTQEMSVMLMAEGLQGKITVQRTATSITKFARIDEDMKIDLQVNIGKEPIKSGRDAQESIESFFPQELERFFFIDGEALEEYTEMMQSSAAKGLQDEVNSVLGIPGLLRGSEDLSKIRQTVKAKLDKNSKALKSSTVARDKYFEQQDKYTKALSEERKKEEQLDVVVKKLEETTEKLSQNKELQPIIDEIKTIEMNINIKQQSLEDIAREKVEESKIAWKVLLWKRAESLHQQVSEQHNRSTELDRTIRSTNEQISILQDSIDKFTGFCQECEQELPDHDAYRKKLENDLSERKNILKKLKQTINLPTNELIIKLGDLEKLRPRDDTKNRIQNINEKWLKTRSDIANLRERKALLNSKITDEAKSNVEELAILKGKQETIVAKREGELKQARSQLKLEELELNRLQKSSGNISQDSESLKINTAIGKLIVTIKDTISSFREKARKEVEITASKVFLKLSNAPEVYTGISVDKEFKTKIRNSSGGYERKPSSGMVSMMTLSVIDALRQVSGIDAPVFLDTPGRSLDEKHKRELLEYFWKSQGHQFLIFAHSGEYSVKETVEKYSDKLAKAWTLTFPSDHKSCFIPKCQSEDVEFDVFEKTNTCNKCNNKWDIKSKMPMILEVKLND